MEQPSAGQCIQAGMYHFGRGELEEARLWWERALELSPNNPKARECLRYLAREEAPKTQSIPPEAVEAITHGLVMDLAVSGARTEREGPEDVLATESGHGSVVETIRAVDDDELNRLRTKFKKARRRDPEEVVAADFDDGIMEALESDLPLEAPKPSGAPRQTSASGSDPWGGPSETSVVTLEEDWEEDPLAENTPMFAASRGAIFSGDRTPMSFGAPPSVSESSEWELDAFVLVDKARSQYALHDFEGALALLERAVGLDPNVEPELRALLEDTRANLEKRYLSRIGPLSGAPRILVSDEEIIWLSLNHRAGFILSQVDGTVSYEDLVALSGMPRLDTLRILASFVDEGVIGQ